MSDRDGQQDEDSARFPTVPPLPEIPEAPSLSPRLPPHPDKPLPGAVEPGTHNKNALAFTAANSFIMPILVLAVGGWYLDQRLHHTVQWLAFVGVLVGLVVGMSSLLNVVKRMQ